jgi:acyl carrier protein
MTLETVRKAIAALGIPEEEITPAARLRGELELDSTELVEVSLELKRQLGVEVTLELADDMTVADVTRTVDEAIAAG